MSIEVPRRRCVEPKCLWLPNQEWERQGRVGQAVHFQTSSVRRDWYSEQTHVVLRNYQRSTGVLDA